MALATGHLPRLHGELARRLPPSRLLHRPHDHPGKEISNTNAKLVCLSIYPFVCPFVHLSAHLPLLLLCQLVIQ